MSNKQEITANQIDRFSVSEKELESMLKKVKDEKPKS